jgi:hypothetical protein
MQTLRGRGDIDGSEWSESHPSRASPLPGKRTPTPNGYEGGWTSDQVWISQLDWTQRLEEKLFASAGDPFLVVQSVVRHCNE